MAPPSAARTRKAVPTDHARSPREDQVGCIASPGWGMVRVPRGVRATTVSAPRRSTTYAVPNPGAVATWRTMPGIADTRDTASLPGVTATRRSRSAATSA